MPITAQILYVHPDLQPLSTPMLVVCRHINASPPSVEILSAHPLKDSSPIRDNLRYSCLTMQVANAPPGTQAATMDVEGAYRTIPVKPDHKRHIVLRFRDEYFIDHNVPFGTGSAHGLQGEVGDATVDIFYSLHIHPVIKWVDDFNIFRYPLLTGTFTSVEFPTLKYEYDLSLIKFLTAPLGIPWHREKGQDFSSTFPYLGFLWDLTRKTIAIPEKKRIKHHSHLADFIVKCQNHKVL